MATAAAMASGSEARGRRSKVPSLLLVAVMSLILLLLCYLLLADYRDQIRKAENSMRNAVAPIQVELAEVLRRGKSELAALSSGIPITMFAGGDVSHFRDTLTRQLSSPMFNDDRMDAVYVVDVHGAILYSVGNSIVRDLGANERAHLRTLSPDTGSDSPFFKIVTDEASGRPVLMVGYAIRDSRGRVVGGLLRQIDMEWLRSRLAASLVDSESAYVAVRLRGTGVPVADWPVAGGIASGNIGAAADASVSVLQPGKDAVFVADDSVLDGDGRTKERSRPRAVFLQAVGDFPLYLSVTLDRRTILSGWYSQLIVVCLVLFVMLALVGMLLLRLGRMREREGLILSDLQHSESKFSGLVQLVPVGVSRFDAHGKCVFVNRRNELITGRSRRELEACDWIDIVHPDDRGVASALWRGDCDGTLAGTAEYRLQRPDGQLVFVMGEAMAERDLSGKVIGSIVAQTDISLLKHVEDELIKARRAAERANQAKTRFLAAASHDLRQPIQAINLFKDALCRTKLGSEQLTIVRFLSLSVGTLSKLLYSLLDISKLDAGLVQPKICAVELDSVFESIDEEFSSLAQQKNLRFKFFYPFNAPCLRTDPALLLSVLRNLIDNAFKYTVKGGVLVGFRKRHGSGVIEVWDTGIGIEEEFGEKIFEECFQIDNASGDRTKGLGFGLSIARRTARLLGGEVLYRSRPGRGSVFEITVPLALPAYGGIRLAEAADARGLHEVDPAYFTGWRVVVLEDDRVVAKSIEMSLQSVGVRVQLFTSAEEALSSPLLLEADFYLSDFVLPGKTGLDFLNEIRNRSPRNTYGMLMTGGSSPGLMESAQASRWHVVLKPISLTDLLAAMAEVVEEKAGMT